jgi:hypothetical protein
MLNWKKCGISGLQVAYFMEYSSTCLEGMRKTIKLLNHDILVSWLRFKPRTPQIQSRKNQRPFQLMLETTLKRKLGQQPSGSTIKIHTSEWKLCINFHEAISSGEGIKLPFLWMYLYL